MLPIPSCIHVFLLSHVFGADVHSPVMFLQIYSFSPWLGSHFWKAQWLGPLLDGFSVVYPHYHLGQTVFVLHNEWEKRTMIYGVFVESIFPT